MIMALNINDKTMVIGQSLKLSCILVCYVYKYMNSEVESKWCGSLVIEIKYVIGLVLMVKLFEIDRQINVGNNDLIILFNYYSVIINRVALLLPNTGLINDKTSIVNKDALLNRNVNRDYKCC